MDAPDLPANVHIVTVIEGKGTPDDPFRRSERVVHATPAPPPAVAKAVTYAAQGEHPTRRTQAEVAARFASLKNNMFGFREDLIEYMSAETAKPLFSERAWADIAFGERMHVPHSDLVATIKDYLPFARDKAESARGMSAIRSIAHFNNWTWLMNDGLYEQIQALPDGDYGLRIIEFLEKHFGVQPLPTSDSDDE